MRYFTSTCFLPSKFEIKRKRSGGIRRTDHLSSLAGHGAVLRPRVYAFQTNNTIRSVNGTLSRESHPTFSLQTYSIFAGTRVMRDKICISCLQHWLGTHPQEEDRCRRQSSCSLSTLLLRPPSLSPHAMCPTDGRKEITRRRRGRRRAGAGGRRESQTQERWMERGWRGAGGPEEREWGERARGKRSLGTSLAVVPPQGRLSASMVDRLTDDAL